jgi:purine-nucleoside/S-methyl-5'-thioadenosine phosphorylase / adenosine deaminase
VRLPPPFRAEGEHIGIELLGARVLFTTRRGGVSRGAFESLNLGLWTDDDPERVAVNRGRLAAAMGVSRERLAHGRQVHGATVRRLSQPPDPAGEPAEADGQATGAMGVTPLVLVADCLPIALTGDGAVAMLHAGWRGLAAGVVEEGVDAVRELGATGRLEAAIGPGAGGCCYRVGGDVLARFERHPEAATRDGGGARLDLKAIAASRLRAAGVDAVHDCGVCTICSDPALFFSHRRDGERTGRQAGAAARQ